VLLAVSVLLAVRTVGTTGKRTRIRQKARGGAIIGSGPTASGGADVPDTARSGGLIVDSPTHVNDAKVSRKASKKGALRYIVWVTKGDGVGSLPAMR